MALKHFLRIDTAATIFCLILSVVLRFAVIGNQSEQLTHDRDVYLGIATNIVEGRGYSSPNSSTATAFRPPLYPLLLAAGMSLFPVAIAVASINVLSGLLTVWLTLQLGSLLQLGWRRFIACALVATDPLLAIYAGQPMTESLCTLLATLWLWLLVRSDAMHCSRSKLIEFASGITFGLLVLCRPTFWLMAVFWSPVCLINCCRNSRKQPGSLWYMPLSQCTWSVMGTILVVGPWLIRNRIVLGTAILTTTHGGYTLLLGNNPVFYQEVVEQPWGTVWQRNSLLDWQAKLDQQIERDLGQNASEVERDKWASQQANQFIKASPQQFTHAVIHRIRSLWNTVPQGDTADRTSRIATNAVGWFYSLVLTSGCIGLIVVLRSNDRRRWLPFYILIASVQLAHLVYWTNARMRAPLTPAIALFAAAAIPYRRACPASPQNSKSLL